MHQPRSTEVELRQALIRLYQFQGRSDDVETLIEANWGKTRDPFHEIYEHTSIDLGFFPSMPFARPWSGLRGLAPTDDRVWLGHAEPGHPYQSPRGSRGMGQGPVVAEGRMTRLSGGHASNWRLALCEPIWPTKP